MSCACLLLIVKTNFTAILAICLEILLPTVDSNIFCFQVDRASVSPITRENAILNLSAI